MFVLPKDKETYEAWARVLPKQRELKPHDKVCERHFHEHEICRTFENNINGLIYKMERGRPRLNPKSVPSLNLDYTPKTSSQQRKRIANSSLRIEENVKIQRLEPDNGESTEIIIHTTDFEEQQLEVDGEVTQTVISTEDCEGSSKEDETIDQVNDKIDEAQVCSSQIDELFESIYDDIYEVVLPNTLWGVHRCPEHSSIFFSYVDPNLLRTTKVVSISSQGAIKVLLGNVLMIEQNLVTDVDSLDALTQMISEIDEILLCSKMFENNFCEVSLKDTSSEFCPACKECGDL